MSVAILVQIARVFAVLSLVSIGGANAVGAAIAAAIVALIVLSVALHLLFSPWLLLVIAVLAWIKFGPRRSRQ